jgi:hypothetical protein
MDNTEIQQSVGYSYPQLKPTEIVQCMEELGISLTKDELLEPQKHKDKIRNIFVQLVGSPSFFVRGEILVPFDVTTCPFHDAAFISEILFLGLDDDLYGEIGRGLSGNRGDEGQSEHDGVWRSVAR